MAKRVAPEIATIHKCNYRKCKRCFEAIDISSGDYIEEKEKFYHPECKHEKDTRAEIIDFWYRQINKDVVFSSLSRIIDRLIYQDGVDCDFLLWGLKKKAKFLKHPPGLVYVARDKDLKSKWEFEKKLKEFNANKANVKIESNPNNSPSFTAKETEKKSSFEDIFGGM